MDDWMTTHKAYEKKDVKTVYYLSMEFLMGRAMGNIIINLKQDKVVREVLDEMGVNLDELEDQEPQRLATAVWEGLPPASWIPCPPWDIPRMAAASAINTECLCRRSRTVIRSRRRMTG